MSKPPLKRTLVGQQALPPVALWLKRASVGVGLAASMALLPSNAMALALGKLNTLSHMGERLNVEIDIPEVAASELQGLRASIAPPDMFQASGVDFNPGLLGAEVSLQKRADGRYYFKVSSPNAINDPFVNLVIVVNWPSGRIVRDYSLLLDPPDASKANPTVVTAPTMAANGGASRTATPAPAVAVAPAAPDTGANSKSGSSPKKSAKGRNDAAPAGADQVKVAAGMTAGEIALSNKAEGLSLDQMLVALLKANPQAFIDGNVNRMRAGAVLNMPGSQDAGKTNKSEARQIITAQSQDFEQYKRKLAGLAPANESAAAKRQSGGQVDTKVTEKKPAAATPDKLQLSTAAKDAKSKEAAIAKELQAKEDAARLATLSKNIKDLKQLGAGTAAGAATSASVAASGTSKAALPELSVNAPVNGASAVASSAPSVDATAAASSPRKMASAVTAPVVAEEPSILDSITDNPLLIPGGAALLAILGGWAWYRQRQRKSEESGDSAFFESRLQTDSFFGVSGGQQIDTQDAPPTSGSSYTASQLNAAADVDPIAEADVYLAYGRDMQAEEILKDAMAAHPNRLAIPLKLLEMYAKRSDNKAFDKLSAKIKLQTNGVGPEWERARELGKSFGASATRAPEPAVAAPAASIAAAAEPAVSSQKAAIPTLNEPAISMYTGEGAKSVSYEMDLDFSSGVGGASVFGKTNANNLPGNTMAHLGSAASAPQMAASKAPAKAAGSPDIIDFDLSALSLDLNSAVPLQSPAPATPVPADPWATKLALAKEFQSIGDLDSARKMVNEVITGAGESVKAEAKKVLAGLV